MAPPPDFPRYRDLHRQTHTSLTACGTTVWWVGADGTVTPGQLPVPARLGGHLPRPLVTAWATKQHHTDSLIRLEPALPAQVSTFPTGGHAYSCTVRTTASPGSTGYKQQIHDQLRHPQVLPEGPMTVQLAFAVGPRRNWLNLWKPTIDALGTLLGPSRPRSWSRLLVTAGSWIAGLSGQDRR